MLGRRQTGLRNKYRTGGLSTYSKKDKQAKADRYGNYLSGRLTLSETVAGHNIGGQLPSVRRDND